MSKKYGGVPEEILIKYKKVIPDELMSLCRENLHNKMNPNIKESISDKERIKIRDKKELKERRMHE